MTGTADAMHGEGYVTGVQTQNRGPLDQISPHRSIYLPVMRNLPLESLYLLNSPCVMKAAEFVAQRLLTDRPKSEPHRVKLAYERIFNRPPTEAEI
ncbi:hypothetical protein GCM10023213_07370 [Prosthecobacter algae]|uniref:DUF1553 domain-containing protein n=2 Tax=Prosthecobacter algae TaxID=1144682 RepID=A0ABP9NVW2_9BACT